MDSWRVLELILRYSGRTVLGLCRGTGWTAGRLLGGVASAGYTGVVATLEATPEVAGAVSGFIASIAVSVFAVLSFIVQAVIWAVMLPINLTVFAWHVSGAVCAVALDVVFILVLFGLLG